MEKLTFTTLYDQLAPQWDRRFPANLARLRCLVELGVPGPELRILDAACGTGSLLPLLLEKQPSQVLAVDLSAGMLAQAQARCQDPRVEFREGDVMELQEGEFDCVLLCDAFQHFENRGSLIRKLQHLLAPGGRVTICYPYGRGAVNANYLTGNGVEALVPLPAARTLAGSMASCFNVDVVVDSPQLYAVGGVRL